MDQEEFQFFKHSVFEFMNDNRELVDRLSAKQFLTLSKDMHGVKNITIASLSYLLINQAAEQILAFRENSLLFADIELDELIPAMRRVFEASVKIDFDIIMSQRKRRAVDVTDILKEMEGDKRNG